MASYDEELVLHKAACRYLCGIVALTRVVSISCLLGQFASNFNILPDQLCVSQENYRKDMSLKDAEVMALSTLKEVMEEKVMLFTRTCMMHAHARNKPTLLAPECCCNFFGISRDYDWLLHQRACYRRCK